MSKVSENATALGVAVLGVIGLAIVLSLARVITRGIALSILWGWYLVPLGIHAISIPTATGFATIALLLQHLSTNNYVDENNQFDWTKVVSELISPFYSVLIGWIIFKLFIGG